MKDYGSYSNEDQLLTLLESMQDEAEEKDRQLAENAAMLAQKDSLIADLRKRLKTSGNSSTVSQLKNKVQEQAQEIVSLNETVRSQNEWIGRLNRADLILKENEKLKAENAHITQEAEWRSEQAAKIVQDNKRQTEQMKKKLEQQMKEVRQKEEAANDLYDRREEHIRTEAEKMTAWEREKLRKWYAEKRDKLNAAYSAKVAAHETQFFATTVYALLITVLSAVKSEIFVADFLAFFVTLWMGVYVYARAVLWAAEWLAGLAGSIGQEIPAMLVHHLLYAVTVVAAVALPLVLVYLAGKRFVEWYGAGFADILSLWVAFVTLAVTIFFAEGIRQLVSVNLLLLNGIVHLGYCGIREYIRGCRRNRGYY